MSPPMQKNRSSAGGRAGLGPNSSLTEISYEAMNFKRRSFIDFRDGLMRVSCAASARLPLLLSPAWRGPRDIVTLRCVLRSPASTPHQSSRKPPAPGRQSARRKSAKAPRPPRAQHPVGRSPARRASGRGRPVRGRLVSREGAKIGRTEEKRFGGLDRRGLFPSHVAERGARPKRGGLGSSSLRTSEKMRQDPHLPSPRSGRGFCRELTPKSPKTNIKACL